MIHEPDVPRLLKPQLGDFVPMKDGLRKAVSSALGKEVQGH